MKTEKLIKLLDEDFVKRMGKANLEILKQTLVDASLAILELEDAKSADGNIESLKDDLKKLNGSYKEAMLLNKAKVVLCSMLLKSKKELK